MEIEVSRSDQIPTRHDFRILHPTVTVRDHVQPGETPDQAYRRISLIVNALFAREVLDHLRFSDRMATEGDDVWCDEFLSTVAADHPVSKPNEVPDKG